MQVFDQPLAAASGIILTSCRIGTGVTFGAAERISIISTAPDCARAPPFSAAAKSEAPKNSVVIVSVRVIASSGKRLRPCKRTRSRGSRRKAPHANDIVKTDPLRFLQPYDRRIRERAVPKRTGR